jgi:hypothetical protein
MSWNRVKQVAILTCLKIDCNVHWKGVLLQGGNSRLSYNSVVFPLICELGNKTAADVILLFRKVQSIMMVNSAQPVEGGGGGVHALSLSLYPPSA